VKQESEFMTALSRRAMLLFGSGLAAFGLGNLTALDADAKKRKRRRRKNKKRKKPQGSFVLVAPEMTGAKEVPGPEDPPDEGDPDGEGSGEITIKGTQICWEFDFTTDTPNSEITGLHIHEGPPDEDGPIVVDFNAQLDGCMDIEGSLAAQIKTNPEDFYANIHTAAHPAGAVRDQLQKKA
jgi:hypothetical protein